MIPLSPSMTNLLDGVARFEHAYGHGPEYDDVRGMTRASDCATGRMLNDLIANGMILSHDVHFVCTGAGWREVACFAWTKTQADRGVVAPPVRRFPPRARQRESKPHIIIPRTMATATPSPRFWSQDRVAILRDMWPDHLAREIAECLGCTRNAVIGKAHQLKLAKKSKSFRPLPFTPAVRDGGVEKEVHSRASTSSSAADHFREALP